jgi:hypothetical protein
VVVVGGHAWVMAFEVAWRLPLCFRIKLWRYCHVFCFKPNCVGAKCCQ